MPGFMIANGGQDAGQGPSNTIETRRKHRWRFLTCGQLPGGAQILLLLQKASRPKQSFEEPVMHHNQEEVYFVGKTKWETITLEFYDAQGPDCSKALWDWVNKCSPIQAADVTEPSFYKSDASLEMIDGVGSPTETWDIYGAWPKETNWNDLDYTTSDIALVSVTMRYDRATRR